MNDNFVEKLAVDPGISKLLNILGWGGAGVGLYSLLRTVNTATDDGPIEESLTINNPSKTKVIRDLKKEIEESKKLNNKAPVIPTDDAIDAEIIDEVLDPKSAAFQKCANARVVEHLIKILTPPIGLAGGFLGADALYRHIKTKELREKLKKEDEKFQKELAEQGLILDKIGESQMSIHPKVTAMCYGIADELLKKADRGQLDSAISERTKPITSHITSPMTSAVREAVTDNAVWDHIATMAALSALASGAGVYGYGRWLRHKEREEEKKHRVPDELVLTETE